MITYLDRSQLQVKLYPELAKKLKSLLSILFLKRFVYSGMISIKNADKAISS